MSRSLFSPAPARVSSVGASFVNGILPNHATHPPRADNSCLWLRVQPFAQSLTPAAPLCQLWVIGLHSLHDSGGKPVNRAVVNISVFVHMPPAQFMASCERLQLDCTTFAQGLARQHLCPILVIIHGGGNLRGNVTISAVTPQ